MTQENKGSVGDKKVLYPVYAAFIILYACIFVIIGVFSAKFLDNIFPKFKKEENKSKLKIFLEILIQISCIAIITYIFREYTQYFVMKIDLLKRNSYGSPDKFAALIIAPTMFLVQPSLVTKINYLVNN